ncbi:MAG: PHP domain-containing protein [Lachnospiraceae bacterium]|nr:PHP domain-containing protein [Lachnospiraceae bacterium]
MKLETHIHTRYSKDSLLCFLPLYLKCRLLHISVVAITEHNNIAGAQKFSDFCKKHGNRLSVIIGDEIFTSQGEIIGLFLKEEIMPGQTAKETIRQIKEQGGIVYVPHPYDLKRSKTVLQEEAIAENCDVIDCIEVHNGRNISADYSTKQRAIADKYGINYVIGSDAHTWLEIGRNYMNIRNVPANADEFRDEIKKATFHTKGCLKLSHQITKVVKLLKMIAKGNYDEIYRIIVRRIKKDKH